MYDTNKKRGDGPLENKDTVAAADIVGNLCRKAFVVHEEEVEFPDIADEELLEAIRKEMSCLFAR